ncbi:MAG: DUF6133 family protein, partial [Ethanoligenens sp.]
MFQKMKSAAVRTATKVKSGAETLCVRAVNACSGEMYVDTAAKILIACVLGMLLLVSLYALYKNNIIPNVTNKTNDMFNY